MKDTFCPCRSKAAYRRLFNVHGSCSWILPVKTGDQNILSARERFFWLQQLQKKGVSMMDEMTQPQVSQEANQPENTGSPETGEKAQPNAAGKGEQARNEAGEPFLTVRYNKQEKPLSREEAAVYAQKGMNYDKVSEKLKAADSTLKTMGELKTLAAEYAAKKGISEAEAPGAIRSALDGTDMQAVVNAQLDAFLAAHPDIDPRKLPDAVLAEWKRGVPLKEAYYAHLVKALSAKAQAMERDARARAANESNAAASMGGAGSMGAPHPQAITDEAILAMSPAELEKNHARIWAYLTGQKN
jgi:hypothetical protein